MWARATGLLTLAELDMLKWQCVERLGRWDCGWGCLFRLIWKNCDVKSAASKDLGLRFLRIQIVWLGINLLDRVVRWDFSI